MDSSPKKYDAIIAGGGLAGLTLALQLKLGNPELRLLVLERRKGEAPTAAHKVGESTVELGSYYLREVLGLKAYLEEHELPKHGLRFFFKSENKEDITSRVELGPRQWLPTPSHQIDRGTLENYLIQHIQTLGIDFLANASVSDVEFGKDFHTLTFSLNKEEQKVQCRWIADATSRFSFLKRKLGFQKPMDHAVNAVWWRLKGVIDIDQWSEDEGWKHYLTSGLRYLSTVHFLDKGYWVWVIPLGTKNTSIGIVADPDIHPFETFDTYEKSLTWLKANEPLLYQKLSVESENRLDFKILKHFAHDSARAYDGTDRWGVTGEAGAFLDPFYSPGTDLISISNTLLSDLILRDLKGEDVQLRAEIYEQTYLSLVKAWIPIYQHKYQLMGSSQIMVIKIMWDWAIYWAIPCLIFTNKGFTDLQVLKKLFSSKDSVGQKFGRLHEQMQKMFLDWLPLEKQTFSNRYIDPFDLELMRDFQINIEEQYGDTLTDKVAKNLSVLEKLAAEIFRHVSSEVHNTSPDLKVNPYTMDLKESAEMSTDGDTFYADRDDAITKDVNTMWFYTKREMA